MAPQERAGGGRPKCASLLLALLLCLCAVNLQAVASSWLQTNSTVILMAGLPGDLESETTFHQQLQECISIASASGRMGKLLVFSDNPGSLRLADHAEPLKADRESFLAAIKKLDAAGSPATVIVFGHGGQQGQTPVFHVRGPRLTPADFKTLAEKITGPSHWILFFPGSGAFARALSGPGREILSSDCETPFHSDPIGMALLLKAIKGSLDSSLEVIGNHVGEATSAWYEERHLARTEEPSFWAGDGKPRLLASDKAARNTDLIAGRPEDTGAGTNSLPRTESEAITNLPLSWKEITRLGADKFSGFDGVVLKRRLTYTLGSSPAVTSERDEFIQVLTPEGKRFGDFDISYSPPYEEMDFLDCEVLRPDGHLVQMDPDAIRDASDASLGDYQIGRRKVFSLPGIVPGAIIHVRYRSQWKTFPLPHISLEVPLGSEEPANDCEVSVSVPRNSPFHFALEHLDQSDPAVSQTSYGASYTWHFKEIAAHRHEILAAPHQRPRLLISTFSNWADFAGWYSRITRLTDQLTPELKAKAEELVRHARDEREKVLALYNYVANLRYVAVPMGVNSFRPHSAANVFKNQYGDCKDKANLFNTMLSVAGIQAHLVLVPRFSQAHDAIPGLSFNHAISRVSLGGETLWVDTTDDVCRFGMLPPGDPGRKVLVIDSKADALTQLPAPAAQDHELKLRGRIRCLSPDEPAQTSLDVIARGFPDYQLRSTAREARDYGESLPLLGAEYRLADGTFVMDEQKGSSISALDQDFTWHAEGSTAGIFSVNANQRILRSPFWLPKEWDMALHRRSGSLFLQHGYPLQLDEEFEIDLPTSAASATLPPSARNAEDPLRWNVTWSKSGDTKIVARLKAELVRGELENQETSRIQGQLRLLDAALARPVLWNGAAQ
jgi:Domain of Unknown Function with PDB structure (DUF3857)/Transglutaminase-like superfamily